jgi:hypothetical protein
MDAVEEKICADIVQTTKAMLTELAEAITPESAPRALRVGENISKHTRKVLAELGLGNMLDTHRRKKLGGGYADVVGMDDDEPGYLSAVGSVGGGNLETFGAQFAQQLGSSMKQILGVISPSAPSGDELALTALMSAIGTAKSMDDPELEAKLRAKVDSLLAKDSGIIDAEFNALPARPPGDQLVEDVVAEAVQQTMGADDAPA